MEQPKRLELFGIEKSFPGVRAVKGVSMEILPGEVHSLVGENGAGKSTLMKMIIGELTPDAGTMSHNGNPLKPKFVSDSQEAGIAMIHQELAPLPNMTISENIFLGQEIMRGPLLDKKAMNARTAEILKNYNLPYKPYTKVSELSLAHVQVLEIIKATMRDADLIIMDEPTSSLSNEESEKLFALIADLRSKGVSIIYISHRLEEVLRISDRITVLRDGQYIKTVEAKDVKEATLVEWMVGRTIDEIYPKESVPIGAEVLNVAHLSDGKRFRDITFQVNAGEIVGFSGLVGAGRSEVMQAIFGLSPTDGKEEIKVEGKPVHIKHPSDAIRSGMALVTEDRKDTGLVLMRSIRENISYPNLDKVSSASVINSKAEATYVDELISKLSIKCHSREMMVGNLSGGNQQKVVIAKWLMSDPKILILDEPTRGVDVGAKYEIYKIMTDLAKRGMGIILVSSELPEIIGMSDRVVVMSGGEITGEFSRDDIISGKTSQTDLLANALLKV